MCFCLQKHLSITKTGCFKKKGFICMFSFPGSFGIFDLRCSLWTRNCGMWDPVPWLGIERRPPALGVWSLATGPSEKSQTWCLLSFFLSFFLNWFKKKSLTSIGKLSHFSDACERIISAYPNKQTNKLSPSKILVKGKRLARTPTVAKWNFPPLIVHLSCWHASSTWTKRQLPYWNLIH